MRASEVVRAAPDVVFQEVEGETVLLDVEAGRYFTLDDVGTRCWQLLVEHEDTEKVVSVMLREYEVGEEELRGDVETLLSRMEAAGLIQRFASSP
jgi:hypothetical protein